MTASSLTNLFPVSYGAETIHQSQHPLAYLSSSPPLAYPYPEDIASWDFGIIDQALALVQRPPTDTTTTCMSAHPAYEEWPDIRLQASTPTPLPPALDTRPYSAVAAVAVAADSAAALHTGSGSWPMYQWASMGGPTVGARQARSHQRTPSASTINSNGPASPHTAQTSYPQIANTDFSPNSPAHFTDHALFSKHLPTPSQTPVDSTLTSMGLPLGRGAEQSSALEAMKYAMLDFHHRDDAAPAPDFAQSSRQSMSSYGNNSPATPQSNAGDVVLESKQPFARANGETLANLASDFDDCLLFDVDADLNRLNDVQGLYRTESQAYQDELYNPPNVIASATPTSVAKQRNAGSRLSPHHNLVTQRLAKANLERSRSPASSVSRERSPFTETSAFGRTAEWRSPVGGMATAAGIRQQQRDQAAQAEVANHQRPQLQREMTRTISPKDALLDYADHEQQPLFQDRIPAGYAAHTTCTQRWPSNDFVNQPGSAFGTLQASSQDQLANFRATSADTYPASDGLTFASLPPTPLPDQVQNQQISNAIYIANAYYPPAKMTNGNTGTDDNPPFPANLTSMESSLSENAPMPSSQGSNDNVSTPQRPHDTRANTGAYTCTYHGCAQRFDTQANLQKHKRDYHRSQHHKDSSASPATNSETPPRSTESPAPSTSGLTSAQMLARNSQAGPHKCTRINPSTNKPCNTVFSRPYDLTRHEDTIHNNRKQKVRCPMCREEKTFSRNDALTRHMRVVHPEVETYGKRGRRGE